MKAAINKSNGQNLFSYQHIFYAILFYLLIFLGLFLQFPLSGSLMGDMDTWGNLSLFRDLANTISSLGTGQPQGTPNYPLENLWAAFGFDFMSGTIHLFFNFFGIPDLWAYYLYISILFSTNSLGIFLIAGRFVKSWLPAFFAGLLFSVNNFVFAQIDNPNTLACFFGFLAIYYFLRFIEEGRQRLLVYAILLTAIQIYYAPYVFIFANFIILVLAVRYFSTIKKKLNIRVLISSVLVSIIILLPFLYIQFLKGDQPLIDPVASFGAINFTSLSLNDFFHTLPNNLLFENFTNRFQNWWISTFKSAFIGIILPLMALTGLFTNWKKSWILLLIAFLGLFLAMGPCFQFYTTQDCFPGPFYLLYKTFGLEHYIRIPIRAFLITMMALSILAAIGFQFLKDKFPKMAHWIFLSVAILYFIEQVPMPFYKYDSQSYLDYDTAYFEFLNEKPQTVILNLPSALFTFEGDRREYYYMYWQTRHKHNTLNGSLGFFPPVRFHNDSLMHRIDQANNLSTLIEEQDIQYVIYHKQLVFNEQEKRQLNFLKASSNLIFLKEEQCCWFFKVK